jgi:post-segregation antitoxin (ccd killing protein)
MTTLEIKIDVPDSLAQDARSAGLLEPRALAAMLTAEVRKSAADRILAGAARARKSGEPPMRLSQIQAVVNEVRKSRKN